MWRFKFFMAHRNVRLHFISNLNLKLFLKIFLRSLTFIPRFHHIIPKNCVYKRAGNSIYIRGAGRMSALK